MKHLPQIKQLLEKIYPENHWHCLYGEQIYMGDYWAVWVLREKKEFLLFGGGCRTKISTPMENKDPRLNKLNCHNILNAGYCCHVYESKR